MAIATKKICSRGHVFQKSNDFPTCPVCWPGRYKSEGKTSKTISTGVVHDVPKDMEEALTSDAQILSKWNGLTPIQRNEWICWTTIVKKPETRAEHIERMMIELEEGKRQPCCWPGCPHRRPKAKKWFK